MSRAMAAIACAIALIAGFGIGALVFMGTGDDTGGTEVQEVPNQTDPTPETAVGDDELQEMHQSCLDALEALEARSDAEEESREILAEYETVLEEAVDALQNVETARLEQILSRIEDLNERAEAAIDETEQADLSEAVETCRTALGADA